MKHISVFRTNNYEYKSYLYSAMKKYGLEHFTFEVIEICNLSEINEREKFWISKLKTLVPNGYNILSGGLALYGEENPFYGKKHTEETKTKISQKNCGRVASQEEREMRRIINLGERNPFYGKTHKQETIKKIVAHHKEIGTYERAAARMREDNPRKYRKYKKVAMLEKGTDNIVEVFENASVAGAKMKELGLTKAKHPSNIITGVCNGYEKHACGYGWKYIDD